MSTILVLTGSPRKNGNSDQLADAFINGARSQGHTAIKFAAAFKDIHGCRACDACWKTDRPCIQNDDFVTELAPLLERADVLVLASPVYWFGMTAQIKAAIDRLYAYNAPACARPLHIRQCLLLSCAEDSLESGVFQGTLATYNSMAAYKKWENLGHIVVPGMGGKHAITGHPSLAEAEKLGASIR